MISGIGIGLPQEALPGGDGEALRRFVTAAEAVGYDSVWVVETTRPGTIDPLAALTYAAAWTTRVRLGTAVLLPAFRPPVRLAHEIASLDRLSGGRAVIGLGLGNGPEPGRAERFETGVRVLRSLLSSPESDRPLAPVQTPTPPIWIGARTRPALDRAVRLADGWVGAGSSSDSAFAEALRIVLERLSAHGRDPCAFTIAKRVYIHAGKPTPAVRDAVGEWYTARYGPVGDLDGMVVMGTPGECAERLAGLRELGTETLILHPMLDHDEQLLALASDVAGLLS